jgi:hypothetical protein
LALTPQTSAATVLSRTMILWRHPPELPDQPGIGQPHGIDCSRFDPPDEQYRRLRGCDRQRHGDTRSRPGFCLLTSDQHRPFHADDFSVVPQIELKLVRASSSRLSWWGPPAPRR